MKNMHQTVNVIAGGESVAKMNIKAICGRAYTIGVNDSAVLAPVDIGVSMDRQWAEYRYERIKGAPFYLLKTPGQWPQLFTFKNNSHADTFSDIPGHLDGANSGFCALNLAYHIRPKKIYMFGFDMGGNYWYEPYPWVKDRTKSRICSEWIAAFDKTVTQFEKTGIEVTIVGDSKIRCFKKISYEEYLNNE